ncbi:hypothetical protein ARMGADRAFT_1034975 [Armillaria gallica]|uniref:Uncharacterized protein n=1 Tax=Armillaria gallica TaxID=47427 RepID=A0A2H3DDA6_ARMGA|nr:hypothetical protein ARMGADRAFT_1034975 [Armillaria gallica]
MWARVPQHSYLSYILKSSTSKMQFNLFNTQLTSGKFNANTPQEHACLAVCLEQLIPIICRTLGELFVNKNELDLVVYDLYDYGAKDNMATLFNTKRHLLGVVYWDLWGPDSIFTIDIIASDIVMEWAMTFILQLNTKSANYQRTYSKKLAQWLCRQLAFCLNVNVQFHMVITNTPEANAVCPQKVELHYASDRRIPSIQALCQHAIILLGSRNPYCPMSSKESFPVRRVKTHVISCKWLQADRQKQCQQEDDKYLAATIPLMKVRDEAKELKAMPDIMSSLTGPSEVIGSNTASIDPPDDLLKKLVFVTLVEAKQILGLNGLQDTEGDVTGIQYPSRIEEHGL